MPNSLLDRLEAWKIRFGTGDSARLEKLLASAGSWRGSNTASLVRLHEPALFLRAYPASAQIARLADAILFSFDRRLAAMDAGQLEELAEPEVSGIAGTSLSAVFSYEVARSLAARHLRAVEIAWDRFEESDRLGPVLARLLPLITEEWPVEAHINYREWISKAKAPASTDLAWLLARAQAEQFDAAQVPVTWRITDVRTSGSGDRKSTRLNSSHIP